MSIGNSPYISIITVYIVLRFFFFMYLRRKDYKTVKSPLVLFIGDFVSNLITGIALSILYFSLFLYMDNEIINLIVTIAFDGSFYLFMDLCLEKLRSRKENNDG